MAVALLLGATATACSTESGDATSTVSPDLTESVAEPTATISPSTPSTTSISTSAVDTTDATVGDDAPAARLDPEFAAGLDAEGFANQLTVSHATMVDALAGPTDRAQAGVDHQLVLRELAGRSELDEAVIAAVDPAARPAVERIVRARQFLQQRSSERPPQPPPDELPAWAVVEPEPVDTLRTYYDEAEQLTGIAWYWLAAIHLQETRMGRVEGVSTAGAVGPMQFLPTTWEVCCTGDPTATRDAIIGAATYLAQSGGPDDMAAAVYEYNPNDGYVAVVTAYADNMRDEPELYSGYHGFQVFVGTSAGTVRLPVGYSQSNPVDAAAHLAEHPVDAA